MGLHFRVCHWLLPAVILVVLFPARASAQTGTLFVHSEQGDVIGAGADRTFTHSSTEPFSFFSSTNRVSVRQNAASFANSWSLDFSTPTGVPLSPGTYITARRGPFTPFNGLNFSIASSVCGALTGRFVVIEADYGANGVVNKFAADFEQHCNDADAGLFGAIRFNSTIPAVPLGGGEARCRRFRARAVGSRSGPSATRPSSMAHVPTSRRRSRCRTDRAPAGAT
jgi:hypothetical protein